MIDCINNPQLETFSASDIEDYTAVISGTIHTNTCDETPVLAQGLVYGESIFPKVEEDIVVEIQGENINAVLEDLKFGTTYYYRTFVANQEGTYYGNELSFTTTIPQWIEVPDDGFEQALIDQGYDDLLDNKVLTENIIGITELDISNRTIFNLRGIQGFRALEKLNCDNTFITSLKLSNNLNLKEISSFGGYRIDDLDISKNTKLRKLLLGGVDLFNLDLTNNPDLIEVEVSWEVGNIDVTNCPLLTTLNIASNILRELDVSQNLELQTLRCWSCRVPEYDLTNNLKLKKLDVAFNYFTYLDVSQNLNLEEVITYNNFDVTEINIANGNNEKINRFWANYSPYLTCVGVDDVDFAESQPNWFKDETAKYSINCE
ncbi:hypothetical protein KXJ69_12255 [Aureisphaera sp. CAU 1614]|uniref:Fibronectin type-III domain-containing protein n=2 Tax=Halomarinibacterium sedimenti TaxID=2857106 RepID=A0A9X1K0X9_9FLAO|nr:hypothetical protein [Halomarinibacterium sedimenti]